MHRITLCRFNSDSCLETLDADIEETQYIAISHVWGPAKWTNVPGIPFEVMVSPHKAQYLMENLPKVVGELPFWMDILCVNQASKAARIAVVDHIPRIYKQAVRTLAIKDGDGVRDCCVDSVGKSPDSGGNKFSNWSRSGSSDLLEHISKKHLITGLTESYLNRLWPLEEILLSDSIQFDHCAPYEAERQNYHPNEWIYRATVDAERIIDSMHTLGYAWLGHGVDTSTTDTALFDPFVEAFLTNGIVTRPPVVSKPHQVSSRDNLIYQLHLSSARTTGKSRDYVLAIMTKYDWYTVPPQAGAMSFSELFLDCHKQACAAGAGFNCKFVHSLHKCESPGMGNWGPTGEIPTPQTLGDFLKLFGPAELRGSPLTVGLLANTIPDGNLSLSDGDMAKALAVIESNMKFSSLLWSASHQGGELSKHGRYRAAESDYPENFVNQARYGTVTESTQFLERWLLPEAYTILDALWMGLGLYVSEREAKAEAMDTKRWLIEHNPPAYKETLVMLAAIVSCGLPMSAFVWAKMRFLPMTARLGEYEILCLLSIKRLRALGWPLQSQTFYAVERLHGDFLDGKDVFITTQDGAAIGFLPDFDAVDRDDDDKLFLSHMRALHYRLYVRQDGQLGLTETIYTGQDREGVFRVGVATQGAEPPRTLNWDSDSSTYRATRPSWMQNFQVIRAD